MNDMGATFYRVLHPPPGVGDGHRVNVMLRPLGKGFTWEIFDKKDNLIHRNYDLYQAPGLAAEAGVNWLIQFKDHL